MRAILGMWIFSVVFFWGWYFLSVNDMHFGMFFLSRGFHEHLFQIYGNMLHMAPEEVPEKIAWLFAIDTVIVFGIAALRWYKSWLPQTIARVREFFGYGPEKIDYVSRLKMFRNPPVAHDPNLIGPVAPAE
jgi:hypothetical protein